MIGGQSGGRLVIADPSGSITRHDITADTIVLGRAPASDIVLSHAVVSSRHAQVSRANGQVTLTDLGSMNGTTVNGVRLAAVRPRTLQDGDRIAIGPFRLVYQAAASAGPAMPGQFTPYPGYPVPGGPGQSLPPGMSAMPGTRAQAVPGMPPGQPPGQPFGQTGNAPARPAGPPAGNVPQQLDLGTKTSLTFGRAPTNDIVLDHPQISRNHATLTRQGTELVLQDLGSTNGTYVNGAPVTSAVLDRNDHIRIGPFDFVLAGATGSAPSLRADDGVRIDGIDLTTRVGKGTIILQSVSLTIFPREFVAVVGGSGWGKSTLVKALAGARPATSGTVLYNGLDLSSHFAAFRTSIGYVPQDDIIHRDLTVERALEYAARLRLPSDTTAAERERRVQEVLHDLNLTPHRAKYIDDLSGGQRKRVSIGVELLTRPNLFFLDEPTSGLDPATETQVMRLLRELADQGRTLVLITHATQNLLLCDKVVFMSRGGYLAFYGTPQEALAHFQVEELVDIYDKLEQEPAPGAYAQMYRTSSYYQAHVANVPPPAPPANRPGQGPGASRMRAPASWLRQYLVLTARYFEIMFAQRRAALVALAILLLQAPVIALLLGLVFPRAMFNERPLLVDANRAATAGVNVRENGPPKNCDLTQSEIDALPQPLRDQAMRDPCGDARKAMLMLFLLAIVAIWLGASSAAKEIVKELPIYLRERMVCVRIVPYLCSKLTVLGAISLAQAVMLLAMVMLMIDFPLGRSGVFTGIFTTVVLTFFTATLMGLCVSALATSTDQAGNVIPILLIPQIIFAGAMLAQGEMGEYARVFSQIVISRWSWETLGAVVDIPRYARAQGGPMLSLLDEQKWKTTFDFAPSGHYAVLIVFGLFFVATAVFALRKKDSL
ncbi:MAG: FHA domain-containing protein [Chloroflexota bacterium]